MIDGRGEDCEYQTEKHQEQTDLPELQTDVNVGNGDKTSKTPKAG